MNNLSDFQYRLSLIHLDLYYLALDIDTTDEEAEIVDKILDSFTDAWSMNEHKTESYKFP